MKLRQEFVLGLSAHMSFCIALFFDSFRRESHGLSEIFLSIGSALFSLPAFIYFVTFPRSFFLLPRAEKSSSVDKNVGRFRKFLTFILSWSYVAGWVIGWLLFAQIMPRPIASYIFMFGLVTTILIGRNLLPLHNE